MTKIAAKCRVRVSELSSLLGWVPIEEAKPTAWERGLTEEEKRTVSHVAELFRAAKAEDPPKSHPFPQRRAHS